MQGGLPSPLPPVSTRGVTVPSEWLRRFYLGQMTKKFQEVLLNPITLAESQGDGARRVKGVGITADVLNANGRRYPASVLEAAVNKAKERLNESLSQGRAILLGEAEHPSDKGGRSNILETVVKWDDISFDGRSVHLEGVILPTVKGKDILALMESGVMPGISQRAYGSSRTVKENGKNVEVIEDLTITGYDFVLEPSDPFGRALTLESKIIQDNPEMDELTLEALREKNPALVAQIIAESDNKKKAELEAELSRRDEKARETKRALDEANAALRAELGIGETDDLQEAVRERNERLALLEAKEAQAKVDAFVAKEIDGLKYPAAMKTTFAEAVKAQTPKTVDEAKAIIIAKRKEYDGLAANIELVSRGYGIQMLGDVLESELGIPEFARGSHEITESLVQAGKAHRRDPRRAETLSEVYAARYLKKYDEKYRAELRRESQLFNEAELTTDLNLPYSVMRAVIAEAIPMLVSANVFDFGTIDTAPTRIYFEAYSAESGAVGTVTDEVVVGTLDTWVSMANNRLNPGTVVLTNSGASTTYVEWVDYVIDYEEGKLCTLSTGATTAAQSLKIDYTYNAVRKGENQPIERAKETLTYQTLEVEADRLATEISKEAVVFSRSQLGWDATTRTISALIERLARFIDRDIIYKALASVHSISGNSGGTYDRSSGTLDEFVRYIGVAKAKVYNRWYQPTSILASVTNAELLSNWEGFKRDGFANATLAASGFAGSVKGLPIFESTQMSDDFVLVVNRELVMHRVLQPMTLEGPFPSYSSNKLLPNKQYYVEEFNGSIAPIPQKGAYVKLQD